MIYYEETPGIVDQSLLMFNNTFNYVHSFIGTNVLEVRRFYPLLTNIDIDKIYVNADELGPVFLSQLALYGGRILI